MAERLMKGRRELGDLWKERKCICRKCSDAESHGDSCCWQLVYRSVKLKGRSVNQEKKVSWLVFAEERLRKGST